MIARKQLAAIFSNQEQEFLENLAARAHHLTKKHFGNCISLYTPLYLSNYCDNECSYCGFHKKRNIKREKLSSLRIQREMESIARKGIRNILLLTGSSRTHSPLTYIIEAVEMGRQYFSHIGVEIYPLETTEYESLAAAGVDSVTIYQETYDKEKYAFYHKAGKKRDYDYRYDTPSRIARAGIRMISMGVLLGLSDYQADLFSLYAHLEQMQKNYPGVEYSLSFPRIIPINNSLDQYFPVSDFNFTKIICLTRILFPYVGMNLSTRESARIRDSLIQLGVTKISAESKTMVGGYADESGKDKQFEITDHRSLPQILTMLKREGLDPVFTDWRRIG